MQSARPRRGAAAHDLRSKVLWDARARNTERLNLFRRCSGTISQCRMPALVIPLRLDEPHGLVDVRTCLRRAPHWDGWRQLVSDRRGRLLVGTWLENRLRAIEATGVAGNFRGRL